MAKNKTLTQRQKKIEVEKQFKKFMRTEFLDVVKKEIDILVNDKGAKIEHLKNDNNFILETVKNKFTKNLI